MNRLAIVILLLFNTNIHAQKFMASNGEISFFSEAPLEDISAVNKNVSAVFDASTTNLAFQVKITDFVFPKALMQEHFNENYLESDIYPASNFLGKVIDNEDGNTTVEGDLTIHGKTNKIKVNGVLIQHEESVLISAEFVVNLDDYNIDVPKIVMYKIAQEIDIRVNITLKKVE